MLDRLSVSAAALFGLTSMIGALPASAQTFSPQTFSQARAGAQSWATPRGLVARVTLNDRPVATLRTSAGGLNPAQRAVVAKQRLGTLLAEGLSPSQIVVVDRGPQGWEIQSHGLPILLVTPREASAQGQAARPLAFAWAGNCKRILAEPLLTLSARQIVVPFGATRTIAVGGAARPFEIALGGGDLRVSRAAFDAPRRRITIQGSGVGQTQLQVRAGSVVVPLTVTVKRFAAQFQPHVLVRVTGTPFAPADLVQNAVYLGLKRALTAEDGAQMRLLGTPRPVTALRPGESVTRHLSVHIAGTGLLSVEASPVVTVVNQPFLEAPATAMFYSNNPEQVRSSRTLFSGPLALFQPVRLDYHHQNRTPMPLIFHADVVNISDQRASVHLIGGIAQPEVDTVQVGRRAGVSFLQALDGGIGYVVDVPAHSRVPLVVQRFAPNLTVSGILQVQQVSGSDNALSLSVVADGDRQALISSAAHFALAVAGPMGAAQAVAPAATEVSGARHATSPYVFGPPRVTLSGAYAAGGKWEHLRLGNSESLRNADGTQTLWGNYGVSYFVTLTLSNPTPLPRTVGVFFAPEAGLAAGVFQIGADPLIQFDPMAPPDEKELTRVRLEAGQTQVIHLRTILLNGSAYPASLIIHAL